MGIAADSGTPSPARAVATLANLGGPVRLTLYHERAAVAVVDLTPAAALTLAGRLLDAAGEALRNRAAPLAEPKETER